MRIAFASLSVLLLAVSPARAQLDCGSPVIDRPLNDASAGLTYVYRGLTQPLTGPSRIDAWSFFNDENVGPAEVTPLILEVTGPDEYTVVAIGTSRLATNAGVQSHEFSAIFGSTELQAGKQYTVGFTHRGYSLVGETVQLGAAYGGVVDFSGYGDFTDPWSYAFNPALPGVVYGTPTAAFDPQGFAGRIYSVNFELSGVLPIPGCFGNPLTLTSQVPTLGPGTNTNLTVGSAGTSNGTAICVAGAAGFGLDGCGTFLPMIGEVLLALGTEFTVSIALSSSGGADLPVSIPNKPSLIGKQVLFQAVTARIQGSSLIVELSNGLLVTFDA